MLLGILSAQETGWLQKTVKLENWGSAARCDYVWLRSEKFLRMLGAKNIYISCSGGWPYSDRAELTASFWVKQPDARSTWKTIEIESEYGCELNRKIILELTRHFHIRGAELVPECGSSGLQMQLEVLE